MTQVNIRIKDDDLEIIKRAAQITQRSFSSFMIAEAKATAERVIEDSAKTQLKGIEWHHFMNRLDQKPQRLENLAKLLRQKPVWDD